MTLNAPLGVFSVTKTALKCQKDVPKMSGDIFLTFFVDILPKPSWTPAGPQDIFVDIFWTFCQRPQRPPRNPPQNIFETFFGESEKCSYGIPGSDESDGSDGS